MAGELERALSSIDLSLNKKDSKYRELATLQSFEQQIESDQQQEMQSELMYQQYEEQVNKYSESLLENDRNAIRKVHNESKDFLREQLKMHGGSYKKFMAAGGLRVLGNYKAGIINSEEANRYKNNAQNMARIIQARDSGMAHLISEKDLFNLNKYETEGGGDITYSGLLSPIELVDQGAFMLGQEIPAEYILKHKNNYSAIYANYTREFPEKGKPSNEELLAYTRKKYASVGKNQAMLQYAQRTNEAKATKKSETDQYKLYTTAQMELANLNKNASGTAGFKVNDENAAEMQYQKGRANNSRIFSDKKFTQVSETEVNSNWNPFTWGNDVNNTRPKGAREFSAFNGSFSKAAKKIYADYYDAESNTYKIPSSQLYGANGSKLDLDEIHNVKPKTVILAQTGKGINPLSGNKNEEEFMVVEFADKNGNTEKGKNSDYINQMKDKNGNPLEVQYQPWQVFEDENGYLYYKKMDMSNISEQKAWTSAIDGQDDITDEIEAQNTMVRKDQQYQIEQETKSKEVQGQVNQIYNDANFSKSVYDNLIVNNKLAKNPDIFESMAIGFARASKAKGAGIELNTRGLSMVSEQLGKMIPQSSISALRNKNLTIEDAYMSMRKGLMEEAETDEDKEQVDLFLDYWASTYEAKTKAKIKLNQR